MTGGTGRAGPMAVLAAILVATGCGSGGGKDAGAGDGIDAPDAADLGLDPGDTAPTDPGIADEMTGEIPHDDAGEDLPADLPPDASSDATDAWEVPDGLPAALPVTFTRPDPGPPIPAAEVTAFTAKVLTFLQDVRYFDYVLYTTHGVDASSGKPDWQFWYGEHFRKNGDLVTFYHPVNLNDGGHNLHIPFSRVLGDTVAAWMITGDATATLAAEKLCKGMSASMLGMVHDADDPLPHLMARNVVPATVAEFTTHDGKRKAVDPSGWFSDYTRWNCERFQYADNPHYGPVWVTSMRSKDDVPHIFRLVPVLRHAAEQGPPGATRDACAQALDLLTAFAKDIVDSDYRIRTKDKDGKPYMPGHTGVPEVDNEQGDLASFIYWRDIIPEGECNARRGAELIGYHHPVNEDCGRGEPNAYDEIAFTGNAYNKRICRYFHLAHVANALVNWDTAAATLLLDGLDERMSQEEALPEEKMQTAPANYRKDLALYLAQSHAFGFPLRADEARMIMDHYGRAVDELAAWPYWDPWAATVPDGDLGGYRPGGCKGTGAEQQCWLSVEDLAQVFETCWSPYVNPAGANWVDCDLVRAFGKVR